MVLQVKSPALPVFTGPGDRALVERGTGPGANLGKSAPFGTGAFLDAGAAEGNLVALAAGGVLPATLLAGLEPRHRLIQWVSAARDLGPADNGAFILATNSDPVLTIPSQVDADFPDNMMVYGATTEPLTINGAVGVGINGAGTLTVPAGGEFKLWRLTTNVWFLVLGSAGGSPGGGESSSWPMVEVSGSTYTLSAADNARVLCLTAATVEITIDADLGEDFQTALLNLGSGQPTFAIGGGQTHVTDGVEPLRMPEGPSSSAIFRSPSGDYVLMGLDRPGGSGPSGPVAIGDVTGLTAALAGKAATSHTHNAAAITDFGAAVDASIAANETAVDVATATDWLNPATSSLVLMPPATWRALWSESELSASTGALAFDPLAAVAPGTSDLKPSLTIAVDLPSNVALTGFARGNMIEGLTYTLIVRAVGGNRTLSILGLLVGDVLSGAGGSTVTISSGQTREITIVKRANGSVRVRVGPAEDTFDLPAQYIDNAASQNALTIGVNGSSLAGDFAMFCAMHNTDDAAPNASGLSGLLANHSGSPAFAKVTGGRALTGAGDTQAFTKGTGTFLRLRSFTFRNVTGIHGTPEHVSGTDSLITVPSMPVGSPGSGIFIALLVKAVDGGGGVLPVTLGGSLASAQILASTNNGSPLTCHYIWLPNVSAFAGGTISWAGSYGYAYSRYVVR